MADMKPATRLLALTLLAGLAACDGSSLLRDNYMGQEWLQPQMLPKKTPRDKDGNPQMQTQSRDVESFWQQLNVWQADPEPAAQ